MTNADQSTGKKKKKAEINISIQRKWCKNCGICTEFCPRKVYTPGKLDEPIISAPELCLRCRLCELRCPEFAITVTEMETKIL
jgi:2-oxoglutarate ferredoxin oxidoreductase subunit delta